MRALRDFEAFWSAACTASGGTVATEAGIQLHCPSGGPPVHGILNCAGLDLDVELPRWQAAGIPFSLTATDDDARAAAQRHGLSAPTSLVLVEGTVADLGRPSHRIYQSVDDFVEILMQTHEIPPFVRETFTQAMHQMQRLDSHHMVVAEQGGAAGCATLFTGAGNAGMYSAGVLSDKRRAGVATSLAQHCMRQAIDLGLEHVVAATTPDGLAASRALLDVDPVGVIEQFTWFPDGPPRPPAR